MAKKIRRGDEVIVIAGGCKGKTGKVTRVDQDRVVVDGVNKRFRHIKKTRESAGRITAFFAPIHVSNVAHVSNNKPVRVCFKTIDGKKYLVNKRTEERIRTVW